MSSIPAVKTVPPGVSSKQLPLWSVRVRGGWKKTVIFQVIHGRQFVRTYSAYDGSPKAHLTQFQAAFRQAVAAWQSLSASEKDFFNHRAIYLKKQYSGYNLFISGFLKAIFRP